jgi:hypothetical protein
MIIDKNILTVYDGAWRLDKPQKFILVDKKSSSRYNKKIES